MDVHTEKIKWGQNGSSVEPFSCPQNGPLLGNILAPSQVDGRCALHLASLHPYKTPFVLTSGFLRRTQSAPLINLGTPSAPPNIRGTEEVLNLECTS